MRLRRPHLPGRTVRARLTTLYGATFLASGAVLLVITVSLWDRGTGGAVRIRSSVPGRILMIAGAALAPPQQSVVMASGQAQGATVLPFHSVRRVPSPGAVVPAKLEQLGRALRHVAAGQRSSDVHQLLFYSAIALLIMAVIAVAVGWLTAGRILRPLRTISAKARALSASNLHERLALEGPRDELRDLGDTFDDLLGRLERSFEAQRRFVSNASHELRTPLATMRALLEVTLAKPGAVPAQTRDLAERLGEELDQVDRLLESFLALARAQRGMTDGGVQSLDALVEASLGERDVAIRVAGLAVTTAPCAPARVKGNETLLRQLVGNLVDNAVRHNAPGGFVRVETSVHAGTTRLVVENDGARLDEAAVPGLVEPFRRHGADRTGSDGGLGLGLSIVNAIAEAHGGRLVLQARPSGGLRALVELPAALERLVPTAVLAGAAP